MLQAYLDNRDGKPCVIVGITRKNVEKLTAHQPMRILLAKHVDEVLIVFGETKPDIIRELEAAGGPQFEAAHKFAAEADPL